jgi:hypothetical protein
MASISGASLHKMAGDGGEVVVVERTGQRVLGDFFDSRVEKLAIDRRERTLRAELDNDYS